MSSRWTSRIGRRVSLRDIHVFLAVAGAGSMGKAAKALAMSQPVVSKAVAALEETLATRLFDRTAQGVELTAPGRAFLERATAVFDELRKGVETLAWLADPSRGELRLGCTEAAAAGLVPAVVDRFTQRFPRVAFRIVTADGATLAERLLPAREIDVAIGALPSPPPGPAIVVEPLFDDRHVVLARRGTRWTRRPSCTLAAIVNDRWVMPPASSETGASLVEAFAAAGLDLPGSRVETLSIPLALQLLATGRYLAVLPIGVVRVGHYTGLHPVNVDWPGAPRSIAIMALEGRSLTPLAQAFIAAVREMAAPLGVAARAASRRAS